MKGLAVGALIFSSAVASAIVVIDDFASGDYNNTVTGSSMIAEAVRGPFAGILGGWRDSLVLHTGGPQNVQAVVVGGRQYLNSDTETSGALFLQYDGNDGESETDLVQTNGIMSPAANLAAENAFRLDFPAVNGGPLGPLTLSITVTTGAGSFTHTGSVANGVGVVHTVAFSNFSGANFADVRRLDFAFRGSQATDFTLDQITAVPEPSTIAALAVGGLALLRRRSRVSRKVL
jgi:hypothetical protein